MYDGFDIEKLIAAWPDENGHSSDPETYHRYREALKAELRRRILVALGAERVDRITPPQRAKLELAFEKLFHSKSVFEINETDIFETYYSVVGHDDLTTSEYYVGAELIFASIFTFIDVINILY